jgi:hypothetical protein
LRIHDIVVLRFTRASKDREWSIAFRLDFAETLARATRQIATDLWSRLIRTTRKTTPVSVNNESGAMTVYHPQIYTISVEPHELFSTVTKAFVIVTGNTHVLFETRETTGATSTALRNRRHNGHDTPESSAYIRLGANLPKVAPVKITLR